MAIRNKRNSVKKATPDQKLKSKLKEKFDWITEEETDDSDLSDTDSEMDLGDDAGADDFSGDMDDAGIDGADDADGDDSAMSSLDPTQLQQLDSEVDELLSANLDDSSTGDEDLLSEDEELSDADTDTDFDLDSIDDDDSDLDSEDDADEIGGDLGDSDDDDFAVTDLISSDDLSNIIDSPNSLQALEDDLVNKITSEDDDEAMDDDSDDVDVDDSDLELSDASDLEENEDPFAGMEDLPGFEQGYEGEDIKDELQEAKRKRIATRRRKLKEDAELASALKDLDFEEDDSAVSDLDADYDSTVSGNGVKGGADSNVSDSYPASVAGAMSESVKKSKMLVKAAATILKLQEMANAEKRKTAKLQFENSKLQKVNALLAVAGDKMTSTVRKTMVESFKRCKNKNETDRLYVKVINVLKEYNKPKLNTSVAKTKSGIKSINSLKESTNIRPDAKAGMSQDQQRKAYLMGMNTKDDQYYKM